MEAVKSKREFKMHPKLLFDTIKRQAGTLGKAVLEGTMNSIEANATAVHINLKEATSESKAILTITDDGKGFRDEQEVELFFETFGQPHDESKENVVWKQFRMGRGQMFAYGRNFWRTESFSMDVDIQEKGLEYALHTNLPVEKGCTIRIELYNNPLNCYPYYSMNTFKEDIQKQVRFVEIPVFFNGEQINTPASDCNWDDEDDYAYYLFNVGTDMTVYNLGVYVQDIRASKAGMAGVVVSKSMLNVNFARNDVDSSCEVMAHMNEIIRNNRIAKTRAKRRVLDHWERQATLSDLRDEQQSFDDIKGLALIKTSQGKHVSLDAIRKNKQQWCFADAGNPLADRLMERDQALCLDSAILDTLGYTGHYCQFFSWLTGTDVDYAYGNQDWKILEKLYVDFDTLSESVSDKYSTLPDKKLTVVERRVLKVFNGYSCWDGRVVNIGMSERANAWTDGNTYITLDRSFLKRMYLTSDTHVNKLMAVMAHEMAHSEDTRGTHVHGPEFYELFYEIIMGNNSPTAYNSSFLEGMRKSRIDEKQRQIIAKQKKAENKVIKKLGIAASVK